MLMPIPLSKSSPSACNPAQANTLSRLALLKQLPLFAGLTEGELAGIAKDFTRRCFHEGEPIFFQGDSGYSLYLIESGQVRIYVQSEDGHELSVSVIGVGDIFGEMAVIDGQTRSASAVAMERTVVLSLDRDRFWMQMHRLPRLSVNFLRLLSVRLRSSTRTMDNLTLSVEVRLARKLLELAQTHGRVEPDGVRISLALTQSDWASLLATSRESVNKALGKFRQQGLIRRHLGQIIITNSELMRALSE